MKVHSRALNESDYIKMRALLLEEGPNEWNYLSQSSIDDQFKLIEDGSAIAVLCESNEILGFAILIFREYSPSKLEKYTNLSLIDYINDVVVKKSCSGKGIGKRMLNECVSISQSRNSTAVYIERHEENLASAGMMQKAGFEIVETYYDPEKRFVGSKNTSVLKKVT